jgi:hypothetical protein
LRTAGRERLDTQSPVQPHTVPVTYVVMGSGVLQTAADEFCVGWCGVALLPPPPPPIAAPIIFVALSDVDEDFLSGFRGLGFRVPSQSGDLMENNLAIFWLHTTYESRKQKHKKILAFGLTWLSFQDFVM